VSRPSRCLTRGLLAVLLLVLCPLSRADAVTIHPGRAEPGGELGYGWSGAREQRDGVGFMWIKGLEADLYLDLPESRSYLVDIHARAFYYGNCQQTFALFVNGSYVDEWTCAHDQSWTFHRYSAAVPADFVRAGRNRLTLRMAYESLAPPQGLSLAVERIVLTPDGAERARGGAGALLPIAIIGLPLLYLLARRALKWKNADN
jgi:hypothetical protein